MIRITLGLILAAVLSFPAAASGFYVGASFGPGWDNESSLPFVNEDTGLHGAVQVGTAVDGLDGLRVELEGYFATHDSQVFGVIPLTHDTSAVMLNAVFDVNGLAMGKLVPYVMAGAGVAHTELTVGGLSVLTVEASGFAYQLGGGLQYQIAENLYLGVGYRHLEAPEVKLFGFELDGGSNDVVEARLRLAFN